MKTLIKLLNEHQVMTLATTGGQGGHATPVFYAYKEEPLQLIFLSDPNSRHMKEIAFDNRVAAGVYLETDKITCIKGAQLWGHALIPEESSDLRSAYFKRFPQARIYHLAHPKHQFCVLKIDRARLIDNRLGLGKNQEWEFKDS